VYKPASVILKVFLYKNFYLYFYYFVIIFVVLPYIVLLLLFIVFLLKSNFDNWEFKDNRFFNLANFGFFIF